MAELLAVLFGTGFVSLLIFHFHSFASLFLRFDGTVVQFAASSALISSRVWVVADKTPSSLFKDLLSFLWVNFLSLYHVFNYRTSDLNLFYARFELI